VGSVHLTLAVEVEPPFDWEGALHHALRAWALANAPGGEGDASEQSGELRGGCVHPAVVRSLRHSGMYRLSMPPMALALQADMRRGPRVQNFRCLPLDGGALRVGWTAAPLCRPPDAAVNCQGTTASVDAPVR
jgi:hypothetical protein